MKNDDVDQKCGPCRGIDTKKVAQTNTKRGSGNVLGLGYVGLELT